MREALKVGVERTAADSASLPVAAPEAGRWRRQVRCPGWGGAAEARGAGVGDVAQSMVKHGSNGRRRLAKLGTDGSVSVSFLEGKNSICLGVKEMHWSGEVV